DAQGTMVFTMLGTDTPAGAPAAIAGNYDPQDRSTGVAVNTGTGTVPQLAVLDGATPQVLSHQAMTVNALPVAYVQNKAEDAEEAPEIAIVSPKSGESPDIERGVWSVEGTFKAPAQVERIEIYVNGNLLSDKADIVLEGNGGTWKHDVVPDKSQSISLEVKLVDAAGNVASASWSGDITVPADDEVVVSPETVVLDAADLVGVTSPNPGMAVSNKQPRYHLGDIIVSGATDELPDGLLGQVIAVVYEEGQYKTILRPVTLGNVILQGEVDLMIGRNDAGEITSAPFDDTEFAQEKDMEEELAKDGNTSDSPSDSDSGDSITTDSSDDGTSTQAGGAFFGTSRGMTGMTVSQPTHLANQVFNAIAGSKHAEKTVSPAHKVVKTDVKEKFSDIPLLYYSCAKDTKKSSKKSMDKGDFTIDAQANFSLKKSECEAGLNIHVKYRSVYKPPSFGAVGDWILSKADRLKDIVDTGYSVIEGDWSLSISAVAWSNFTMDMDISGKVSVKLSDDAKKRLTKELASKNYTFNIGPVPVVINLRATVGPILQFNFEAKVNLHAEYHVWIERGFRIRSNGKLEKISHTPEPKKAFAVKGEVNMDASIGLEIKPEVSIYGLLNFAMPLDTTVDAEAKASEKVDVDLTKPLTFESLKKKKEFTTKGDLVIQLNAEIGVTIDIGRIIKPLLNQQIRDLLSPILNKSITLLEKTVPIAKTAIPLWKFPTKKDKDSQEKPTDPSHEDPEQTEDEKDAAAKKLVDE
ncbi:MAG: hypothetical protein Q4P66_10130, partial [Actinomycetaceae bacterium]|nr:hypothetical protein [Actinomycetaceae bacterium]